MCAENYTPRSQMTGEGPPTRGHNRNMAEGSGSAKATGGPGACKMMEQIRVETTLGSDTSALRMEEGIPATQRQAPFT